MTEEPKIKVLCVDDHPLVRKGIASILSNESDMQLVAEAGDGREAVDRFREFHPDVTVVFAERHDVRLTPGGVFAKLLGAETVRVNSLHGQGILEPGERVVVEAVAEDGTIEAISIAGASGFALGVQWHAEHEADRNPVNRKLFEAFGAALAKYERS